MSDLGENISLCAHIRDVILLAEKSFGDDFHGEDLVVMSPIPCW